MPTGREDIRRLMITINRLDELYYQTLRTRGIKENAFVLFYAIADGKAYSQKRICQEWAIPRTTLNTIVQEYLRKGYLCLASTGGKEKEILLTEVGKAFAQALLAPIFAAEERAMAPFRKTGLVEEMEGFAESLREEFAKMEPPTERT